MRPGGEWRLAAPWGSRARRFGVVLLAASALATGAAWYGAGMQAGAPGQPPPAFYRLPDPLPLPQGPPDRLIRATRIAGPASLPGARAWAVLYHSRSADGRDVAVSGLVVAPPGRPPAGGRPVLAWAHATTGLADRCAPSARGLAGLRAFGRVWLARLQGAAGGTVPTAALRALTVRQCELGGRVLLTVYPGIHHGKVTDASGPDVLAWIHAHLAGTPARTSCPA